MMSKLLNTIRQTPFYSSLLEQVPEDERAAAISALEEQLRPYEALLAGLPQSALDGLLGSLNSSSMAVADQPTQRAPRRF